MILELTVENLAIIDHAEISFGRGLTVLTGETGAGKSLLIDAIGLVLGERADSDRVRSGADKGSATLLVGLSKSLASQLDDLGVSCDDQELLIQREVSSKGRSSVRLNGKASSVGILKQIGELLVDMHGQHDHQSLLDQDRQAQFLDDWIGEPCYRLKRKVADKFAEVESIRRRLNALQTSQKERELKLDMLRHQAGEIRAVGLEIGELAELESKLKRLQNAESVITEAGAAVEALQEAEGSAIERLSTSLGAIERFSEGDKELTEIVSTLREAQINLEEGTRSLRHFAEGLDLDPETLEQTAGRVDEIRRICRKYDGDEETVLNQLVEFDQELADIENFEASSAELESSLTAQEKELQSAAQSLTDLRTDRASDFTNKALVHIQDLALDKARFEVRLTRKPIDAAGQDQIELIFSANPGEALLPIDRSASGGELSRVMLAIKAASAGRAGVPTLIFDEVDTGLSGRAAAIMAKKLKELSRSNQVIVISHLPQIAGQAEAHWKIDKQDEAGRSVTRLEKVEGDFRVIEIARMLAGEKIGESALANAKELLK
jgi:DNA repair protein RecN (Recombination protein N)